MFVKIVYWRTREGSDRNGSTRLREFDHEVIYDCQRVSIAPVKPEPPKVDVEEMCLIMDMEGSGQSEWTVTFPINQEKKTEEVDIYVMNEAGKTIEHYSY